jgi:hypothetical protein
MKYSLSATKKGLITGCVMIALSLFSCYVLKLGPDSSFQYINFIIYTTGIAWSMIDFARFSGPKTEFRDYFSNGFRTFIVVCFLMAIYTFVFYSLHPEIRDAQILANNQLLILQHTHTTPEIEENAKQLKAIFMPGKVASASFLYLFLGAAITTLYAVLIMKKQKR